MTCMMEIEWIDEAESTNSLLRQRGADVPPMRMVCARSQTAGRGQRGNRWEAEPGKNLTFSFRIEPDVPPAGQFVVSEAVALAVADALADFGIGAKVKWPNDIYVGSDKICGILIENSIMGTRIANSIIGVGLNVNQRLFLSDAPNPVSMAMLAGRDFPLMEVALALGRHFEKNLSLLGEGERLHSRYLSLLWRGDGRPYPFRDAATGEEFRGVIREVEPSGHLLVETSGALRRYAFKEIIFL